MNQQKSVNQKSAFVAFVEFTDEVKGPSATEQLNAFLEESSNRFIEKIWYSTCGWASEQYRMPRSSILLLYRDDD